MIPSTQQPPSPLRSNRSTISAEAEFADVAAANADLTDVEALQRFAEFADADAFRVLADRHAAMVYATCLRVTGRPAMAEDATQEVFFRLLHRWHEINQSLPGWLHRTATHVSLDILRSESARRRREITYARQVEFESRGRAHGEDHDAASWAELSPAIDAALAEMPEAPRMLLIAHFLLGKTQARIAHESGQSPATVCRRVQEAVGDLRVRLRLKGISTLPALLAALLCQVHARQAPAAVLNAVGKMAMLHAAALHVFNLASRPGGAAMGRAALSGTLHTGLVSPRGFAWIKAALLLTMSAAAGFGVMRAAETFFPPANFAAPTAPDQTPHPSHFSIQGCLFTTPAVAAEPR